MCCVVSFADCVASIVQIQTPATISRDTDVHSNTCNQCDLTLMCKHRNISIYPIDGHMSRYSQEANCNVSELNENHGFRLHYATKALTLYCRSAFPSTLWSGMFYQNKVHVVSVVPFYKVFRSIRIENCHVTTISSKTFKGLKFLRDLTIQGGN